MKRKHDNGSESDEDPNPREIDRSESELDSLPLDLKLAILSRLPAKSLSKFRCVSKTWSSIIRSPEFVRSFFSISSKQPRFTLALSNGISNDRPENLLFLFSFSTEHELDSVLVPNFDMAIPLACFSDFTDLSASCTSLHGLLALEVAHQQLFICNPSTEQFIKLPLRIKYVGYDPIHDQYKAFAFHHKYPPGVDDYTLEHKVFTFGQDTQWRHVEPPSTTPSYSFTNMGLTIDGFIYYGAYSPSRPANPGIVCFDVVSEKLTYIKAPEAVVYPGHFAIFIEYKGKFASLVHSLHSYPSHQRYDLWVLEDIHKHEWSVKRCLFPLSVWEFVYGSVMSFPGTNKAGEIIMAPSVISNHARPFYIFYYNVDTQNIRRVRLHGIGENQDFLHSYGFVVKGDNYHVCIAPQHVESIHFLNNLASLPPIKVGY